ncbi:MAG: YifB family Mg chelatase-like AAA ATPase [Nocardioidaceae bacterium]
MALARTRSIALDGMRGRMIEIEVDIANGLPKTVLVGLPDTSLAESRDRCHAAVGNSGHVWPNRKVTVNLSPATVPKAGSHYDLGIALCVLAATDVVPAGPLVDTLVLGELSLDGRLRAVAGVLPATLAAVESGCHSIMVPEANAAEAMLIEGAEVTGVRSLRHAVALLTGEEPPDDPEVPPLTDSRLYPFGSTGRAAMLDLADVVGQDDARAAVVVAAAGGHHVRLTGPPGVGKTMLAERMPALLPDLDQHQSMETSAIYSVAGRLGAEMPLLHRPPFVEPHHTASAVSIVGGGSKVVRPGAMSLAHNGLLFMDEAPEFNKGVLDALRQPLESGHVTISRATQTAEFPARFQLVLAANPCPCGLRAGQSFQCTCTSQATRRYTAKISTPVLDRIDIHREVTRASQGHLGDTLAHAEPTPVIADRVALARERQLHRLGEMPWRCNAEVPATVLRKQFPLAPEALVSVERRLRTYAINARTADRVIRLAWTLADLDGVDVPGQRQVDAAIALRDGVPMGQRLAQSLVSA